MSTPSPRHRALAVVAEDEPLMRFETSDFLADEGYEVAEAHDAASALAAVERLGGVDLLFTDVRMPGERDGADLAREVARRWPGTRIIVCSALPRPDALPGGAHFFDKPFLAAAVRKALG
ncbi:response regulator [Methylobacterium sp. NEAU 140]|uniref:response regulator n=1 Tax=Methylobacterium sp. NEAU 140 TaxID=3064945 RepID=UPI002735F329|nr:response regulator [Methylobacterium sp. NEAU 140]MDP4026755.1 response regulator [Methylobacterium sp. NEAU 140]